MDKPLGGHPRFYALRAKNEELYSAKHYQYATDADPMSNFRLCGNLIHKLLKPGVNPTIAAALTLMSKQIVGVYEIVGEGKENTIESLEDKLRDIEIYASILQVLVEESENQLDQAFGVDGDDYKPVAEPKVQLGPYCHFCEQLAEFRHVEEGGPYMCSNCRVEQGFGLAYVTLMEKA